MEHNVFVPLLSNRLTFEVFVLFFLILSVIISFYPKFGTCFALNRDWMSRMKSRSSKKGGVSQLTGLVKGLGLKVLALWWTKGRIIQNWLEGRSQMGGVSF